MEACDWDRRWQVKELHVRGEPSEPLVAEVSDVEPGRALDLACGAGRNAVWLAERGWKVKAVDFSKVALRQARDLSSTRGVEVDWVLADLRAYDPPGSAFELVVVLYLHLPAEERRAVLEGAAAAVAEGGRFLLLGHDLTNLDTGAPGPTDSDLLYTPDDIVGELPGLAIDRAERIRRPVSTPEGEVWAVDALVSATRR